MAGTLLVLIDSTGFPIWMSPVEPGSVHDLTAACAHVLPALYSAAAKGLPILADKGYAGAGIVIKTPFKGTTLDADNHSDSRMQRVLRPPAERGNVLIKDYRVLRYATLSPHRIGAITAAC